MSTRIVFYASFFCLGVVLFIGIKYLISHKPSPPEDDYQKVQVGKDRSELYSLDVWLGRKGTAWLRPGAQFKYNIVDGGSPDTLSGTGYFDLLGSPCDRWKVVGRPNWRVETRGPAKFVLEGLDSAIPHLYVLQGNVTLYTPVDSIVLKGKHGVRGSASGLTVYPIEDTIAEVKWVKTDTAYHFSQTPIDSVVGLLTWLYDCKKSAPTRLLFPTVTGALSKKLNIKMALESVNKLLGDSVGLEYRDSTIRVVSRRGL